ncbi:MAG: FkbM family methyltransferase [Gemmatimonadaceae bacterium]
MNFSGLSNRSLAGKALRIPLRLIPASAPVPILQGPLRGKLWVKGSSDNGCWLGSFEYGKQRLMSSILNPGDTMYDVGANVGYYTLLASHRVGPTGRVISFEPLPANVRLVERHLRLNRVKNVLVQEVAVSDHDGRARFAPHASNAMGKLSDSGSVDVAMVSLDSIVETARFPDPNLLKIDVEGAELGVLVGASQLLERARPSILLATHGPGVHRQCCDFLRNAGYQLRPIDESVASIDATDEILATPR